MAVMVIAIVGMILDVPVLAGAKVKTEKFSCTVYVGKNSKCFFCFAFYHFFLVLYFYLDDKLYFFTILCRNMYCHVGMTTAKDAMKSWKGSSGHYKNLLRKEYVCGAIAVYGDVWPRPLLLP